MTYKTKEQKQEYNKKWYQDNKDRIKEGSLNYYQENKDVIQKKRCQKRLENIDVAREKERIASKNYRENNRDTVLQYKKEWYQENKDQWVEYYQNNIEAITEYSKKYYRENKDQILEERREYQEENKENIAIKKQEYYIDNRDAIIAKACEYFRDKKLSPQRRFTAAKAKSKVKKRGLSWTLSYEQYCDLIIHPCNYCNDELGSTKENCGVGLDRLDNSIGYELNNVVSCCGPCNVIRNDKLTPEETKIAVQAVVAFRKNKLENK